MSGDVLSMNGEPQNTIAEPRNINGEPLSMNGDVLRSIAEPLSLDGEPLSMDGDVLRFGGECFCLNAECFWSIAGGLGRDIRALGFWFSCWRVCRMSRPYGDRALGGVGLWIRLGAIG